MKFKTSLLFVFAMMFLPINEAYAKGPKYDGTRIVAHRGFWNCEEAGYAKNSIASLKCAQQAGDNACLRVEKAFMCISGIDYRHTILNMEIDMLTTDYPLLAREIMKSMEIQEINAGK